MSYGELSPVTIVMSEEIGWCSTIWKMQCISEFHVSEASSIDIAWWGLQPLACFLASDNGAFGCCWYWFCDALELLFMQAVFECSDCCICCYHGLGMLTCLKGSLIFQFTTEMAALQTSLLAW